MVKNAKKKEKKDAVQKPGKLMLNNPLIPPELDEDIDDDLAFDSDDEKMYGHFFNKSAPKQDKKSKKKSKKSEDITLHQLDNVDNFPSDGEDDASDNEEFIDLSDMMDMNIKEERKKKKKPQMRQTEDGRLVTKKRRAANITEEAESLYGMSESGVDGTADSFGSAMLNYLGSADAADAGDSSVSSRLKHTLSNTHNVIALDEEDYVKDRLDRKEVRTLVDENMKKYKPLLRELSTSKHIQFPMKPPGSVATAKSTGGLASAAEQRFLNAASSAERHSSAAVQLASKMDALLTKFDKTPKTEQDGNQFGEVVEFDQRDGNGDDDGDDAAPTIGYMSKLKSMLAIENSRRKRFKKIKSKTYRRILRKEKDREKDKKQKAFELLHPELARKRMTEKLLKARAEERVTQKHKNTSAWVKHAKRFVQYDNNAKDAVNEQLMLHQQLMQKMEDDAGEEYYNTYADEERSNPSSEEEERVVDELLADNNSKGNSDKVTSVLWKAIEGEPSEAAEDTASNPIAKARAELKEMKFMKQSKERREKEMQEDVEQLAADIRRYQQDPDAPFDDETAVADSADGAKGFAGRRNFAATKKDATNIVQKRQKGIDAAKLAKGRRPRDDADDPSLTTSDQEWDVEDGPRDKREKRAAASAVAAGEEKTFAGDRSARKKTSSRITILPGSHVPPKRDHAVEAEEEKTKSEKNEDNSLQAHQDYLVSRAFAHDDIDEDFVKQKTSQVETIMKPEDVNDNLPGWGEWGGEDPKLNKRHQEKVSHSNAQRDIEKTFLMKSRADAALSHVIINHDGVELVPDRMTLHMVPRPFSNPEEFARSMRQPTGPEWSSSLSFKESIQPRVEVRQGNAVEPLDISLRRKVNKTKRRKTEHSK